MCIALKLTLFHFNQKLFFFKKKKAHKSTVHLALISTEPKFLQSLVSTKFSKTLDNYIPTSFMEKNLFKWRGMERDPSHRRERQKHINKKY